MNDKQLVKSVPQPKRRETTGSSLAFCLPAPTRRVDRRSAIRRPGILDTAPPQPAWHGAFKPCGRKKVPEKRFQARIEFQLVDTAPGAGTPTRTDFRVTCLRLGPCPRTPARRVNQRGAIRCAGIQNTNLPRPAWHGAPGAGRRARPTPCASRGDLPEARRSVGHPAPRAHRLADAPARASLVFAERPLCGPSIIFRFFARPARA